MNTNNDLDIIRIKGVVDRLEINKKAIHPLNHLKGKQVTIIPSYAITTEDIQRLIKQKNIKEDYTVIVSTQFGERLYEDCCKLLNDERLALKKELNELI